MPAAIALIMIVEITSDTLRVTLSTAGTIAHEAPASMATTMMKATCSGGNRST